VSVFNATISVALALFLGQPAASAGNHSVQVFRPAKWTYSCPPENVGSDGQILCRATYLEYPSLDVERTDKGMKLRFVSQCGYNKNPNKLGKYIYQPFVIPFSFYPPASDAKQIGIAFANALAKIPNISRKVCGSEHAIKTIKIEQDEIDRMIEVVFIQKKLSR
jgi:hypothetical protein